jgi:hypothetical protein
VELLGAPVQLKPCRQDDNDGRKHACFEHLPKQNGCLVIILVQFPSIDPFTVVSSAGVILNANNGYAYQLPSLVVISPSL